MKNGLHIVKGPYKPPEPHLRRDELLFAAMILVFLCIAIVGYWWGDL